MFRLVYICLFIPFLLHAQQKTSGDSLAAKQKKLVLYGSIGTGLVYAGSFAALSQAWYQDQSAGNFRFFNDLNEWGGMDKLGHFTTSWWITGWLYDLQTTNGLPARGSLLRASLVSGLFMTTIEVFDGFSEGYGFSAYDALANFAGIASYGWMESKLGKQFFVPKYSYNATIHPSYRPQLLGENTAEKMLKNYNGQTYWLSIPLNQFTGKYEVFPPWLCLSAGHSISGFLGGKSNPMPPGYADVAVYFDRYHEWKLSLDIDLSRIRTRSKALKILASTFRWVKIPAPVLMYTRVNGINFRALSW